jgi:hypothetical protein
MSFVGTVVWSHAAREIINVVLHGRYFPADYFALNGSKVYAPELLLSPLAATCGQSA